MRAKLFLTVVIHVCVRRHIALDYKTKQRLTLYKNEIEPMEQTIQASRYY